MKVDQNQGSNSFKSRHYSRPIHDESGKIFAMHELNFGDTHHIVDQVHRFRSTKISFSTDHKNLSERLRKTEKYSINYKNFSIVENYLRMMRLMNNLYPNYRSIEPEFKNVFHRLQRCGIQPKNLPVLSLVIFYKMNVKLKIGYFLDDFIKLGNEMFWKNLKTGTILKNQTLNKEILIKLGLDKIIPQPEDFIQRTLNRIWYSNCNRWRTIHLDFTEGYKMYNYILNTATKLSRTNFVKNKMGKCASRTKVLTCIYTAQKLYYRRKVKKAYPYRIAIPLTKMHQALGLFHTDAYSHTAEFIRYIGERV